MTFQKLSSTYWDNCFICKVLINCEFIIYSSRLTKKASKTLLFENMFKNWIERSWSEKPYSSCYLCTCLYTTTPKKFIYLYFVILKLWALFQLILKHINFSHVFLVFSSANIIYFHNSTCTLSLILAPLWYFHHKL